MIAIRGSSSPEPCSCGLADICNLTYQELSTTAGNYIRLETLKEANDRIANATARLPIFRHFDIDEAVHSSSDGLGSSI